MDRCRSCQPWHLLNHGNARLIAIRARPWAVLRGMKKMTFAALLALFALSAAAQPAPDPMLRQLDWFAHDYRCTGIAYANPMAPEHATRADVTGAWMLDGRWVRFSYTEKKTSENPKPFTVTGYMGYDAEIKKLVIGAVDVTGGYA